MEKYTLFFSDKCPDTLPFKAALAQKGLSYRAVNITESMANLKEFLALRDGVEVFDEVKAQGRVGVPLLVTEDGRYIFEVADL